MKSDRIYLNKFETLIVILHVVKVPQDVVVALPDLQEAVLNPMVVVQGPLDLSEVSQVLVVVVQGVELAPLDFVVATWDLVEVVQGPVMAIYVVVV